MFAIPTLVAQHVPLLKLLETLLAAAAAGAAGGLVHGFAGDRLLGIPRFGPYIWGVACVSAYMLALFVLWPFIAGKALATGQPEILIFVVVTIFFGLVLGFGYARGR